MSNKKKQTLLGNFMKKLIPLILIIVFGINLVLFVIIRNNNKKTLNTAMSEIVNLNTKEISQLFKQIVTQLDILSELRTSNDINDSISKNILQILLEKGNGQVRYAGYTKPDGTTITTLPGDNHKWKLPQNLITQFTKNKYFISDKYFSRDNKGDVFLIHVSTMRNNKMAGILTVALDAKHLNKMLRNLNVMGAGESMIVNSQTSMVVVSNGHPEWEMKFKLTDSSNYKGLSDIGKNIKANIDILTPHTIVAPDNKAYALMWQKIEYTNWHLVFLMPVENLRGRNIKLIKLFIFGVPIGIILFAFAFYLMIKKHITNPIKKLNLIANNFISGQIYKTETYKAERNDEIGNILESFGEISKKLNSITQNIRAKSEQLLTDSKQLNNIAQHISSTTEQQSVETQSMKEILTFMIDSINDNANNANDSQNTSNIINQNLETITQVILKSLRSTRHITNKIQIINEIAFKTKLLAVNAAVEASKAGDEGKGFAVVADEIKKLAEKCRIAASQIDEVSTENAKNSEQTAKLFSNFASLINQSKQKITAIATTSKEQKNSSQIILQSIEQLSQLSQQNAHKAEEMAKKAETFSKYAQSLTDSVKFLKTNNSVQIDSIKQQIEQHTHEIETIEKLLDYKKSLI